MREWNKAISDALTIGHFTPKDREKAKNWESCYVGENITKRYALISNSVRIAAINRSISLRETHGWSKWYDEGFPATRRIGLLGLEFNSAVERNEPARAEEIAWEIYSLRESFYEEIRPLLFYYPPDSPRL